MKQAIRKKSFLLVEVLCCLALISMVLFPIIRSYINLYQLNAQELLRIKKFFIQQNALAHVKEKLYLHKYLFSDLHHGCVDVFEINNTYCKANIHSVASTEKSSLSRHGLLVHVDLYCGSQNYQPYDIFLEGIHQ